MKAPRAALFVCGVWVVSASNIVGVDDGAAPCVARRRC
jgi:hypothetical protein